MHARYHAVRWLATALAASAVVPGARSAERSRVTVDDLMGLRSTVDVRISPDGERIAYVVSTPSLERNEHEAALFVVSSRGGEARRLAQDTRIVNVPLPAPRLRWVPGGDAVSVVARVADRPQVFAVPLNGGAPAPVTAAPEGVVNPEWAPDGRSLAYVMRDAAPPDEERRRKDGSFVVQAGAPERPTRLWVHRIGDGDARVLTPAAHYVDSFSWSPDGREIVYSAAPRTGFTARYETRLYAVAAAGGDPRAVVDRAGMNTMPRHSPDGRWIAFVTTNERTGLIAPRGLAVVPASGGGAGSIRSFGMDGAWIGEHVWAADSRSIFTVSTDGTFATGRRMFEQPIVRVWVDSGQTERVTSGPRVHYTLSLSQDGRRLAHRVVESRTMSDVFVLDVATGATMQVTDVNPELRGLALGRLEPVRWRSFDGMEIWGLLLTPAAAAAGRPLPLLVYCHGGPIGGVTYGIFPQFMHAVPQVDPYPAEAMASAGFAVLFPMPRGGSGYGEAGHRAIIGSWGEGDFKDIMAGVDALVAQGVADPERLGVMGASYGGYMTNWIVTQTDRFKAASAGASISDLTDVFYLPDGGELMVGYFGYPWAARDAYAAHSPLTFVERVKTPLLIQHGERDPRVPIAGAWKFYRALQALGRTVELDIYPRGGHVLYEPVLQREAMRRNLEWFTRWIGTSLTPR
jgi:dipeptidyl aminopeptidase/acylaminoacyl peptidase